MTEMKANYSYNLLNEEKKNNQKPDSRQGSAYI